MHLVGGGDAEGSGDGSLIEAPRLCLDAGSLAEVGMPQQPMRALVDGVAR